MIARCAFEAALVVLMVICLQHAGDASTAVPWYVAGAAGIVIWGAAWLIARLTLPYHEPALPRGTRVQSPTGCGTVHECIPGLDIRDRPCQWARVDLDEGGYRYFPVYELRTLSRGARHA